MLQLTGLAAISIGVFAEPVPGDPTTYASGVVHIISAAVMFFSLAVVQLLIGWQARKQRDWRGYGWYSVITGLLIFLLLLLSSLFYSSSIYGLVERLLFLEGFAWYVVIGTRSLVQPSRPSRQEKRQQEFLRGVS